MRSGKLGYPPEGLHNSAPHPTSSKAGTRIILEAATGAILERKGLDVRTLDMRGVNDIADYFLIASGTSERHVQGIAEKVREELKKLGETPNAVDGEACAEWILLDYGNFVVHIFFEPARQYYEFDELWSEAKLISLPPELEAQARRLRTGIVYAK